MEGKQGADEVGVGMRCRYAEMRGEDKNKISHRYRALEQLKDYLASQP